MGRSSIGGKFESFGRKEVESSFADTATTGCGVFVVGLGSFGLVVLATDELILVVGDEEEADGRGRVLCSNGLFAVIVFA
jgi:hypothetical protein